MFLFQCSSNDSMGVEKNDEEQHRYVRHSPVEETAIYQTAYFSIKGHWINKTLNVPTEGHTAIYCLLKLDFCEC